MDHHVNLIAPDMQLVSAKSETIGSYGTFCTGQTHPAHPLEVFIEISNVCDLNCVMCAEFSAINPERTTKLRSTRRGFLKETEIVARLDPILRHCLAVHCSGFGEATIHPDFKAIIERVSTYQVMVDFITNGMQLAGELGDFIVEQGVHRVMISLSGASAEVYEKLYVGGDFKRVLAGIRRVAAAKRARGTRYPLIEINSLGFRDHVTHFDDFVALMAECGADVIHLKKLQPYQSVPHLFEHVSVFRPWVEGNVIERAMAIGRRHGVHVDAGQYLEDGVANEAGYQARMATLSQQAEPHLGGRPFGSTPITDFADLARSLERPLGNEPRNQPNRILPDGEDQQTIADRLGIATPPGNGPPFFCTEPFKTMYVNRNAGVKTCCFARNAGWLMGDVGASDAAGIWQGDGYKATRNAILAGLYPLTNCDFCLENRVGPAQSNAPEMVRTYLEWHTSRFGNALRSQLAAASPQVLNQIYTVRDDEMPARHQNLIRESVATDRTARSVDYDHIDRLRVEGNLERSDCDVAGWVWSPAQPQQRLAVQVWSGGRLLIEEAAFQHRQDLIDAGKGDGCHGFHFVFPEAIADLRVTVKVDDVLVRLPNPQ